MSPKKSVDRPPKNAAEAPRRAVAMATLNGEPPAAGRKPPSPGKKSIRASPQETIIACLAARSGSRRGFLEQYLAVAREACQQRQAGAADRTRAAADRTFDGDDR